MRTLMSFVIAIWLVSCGPAPDPSFTPERGDLALFLFNAISNRPPTLEFSNRVIIETTWHSRVLDKRHKSGEYLENDKSLQIATSATNFPAVESLFTSLFGPPSLPLRQEPSGWQHMGWARTNRSVSVWLKKVGDQCQIELVGSDLRDKQ